MRVFGGIARERVVDRREDGDAVGRVERVDEAGLGDRGDQGLEQRVGAGGGGDRRGGHAVEGAVAVGGDRGRRPGRRPGRRRPWRPPWSPRRGALPRRELDDVVSAGASVAVELSSEPQAASPKDIVSASAASAGLGGAGGAVGVHGVPFGWWAVGEACGPTDAGGSVPECGRIGPVRTRRSGDVDDDRLDAAGAVGERASRARRSALAVLVDARGRRACAGRARRPTARYHWRQ